ncbi:hypothetical protein BC833DRAFT_593262 [Globomyces pollinis-pini]|nr:hypothetical protein BC833DRAFT_593262 [Globomyces pollinis-pini]
MLGNLLQDTTETIKQSNLLPSYNQNLDESDTPVVIFNCEWNTCLASFNSLRDLVIHVNNHIMQYWLEKNEVDHKCRWRKCWNSHAFISQSRMLEHIRAHTLEKPYGCPVKSCGLRFAIRSNCMAHGRTRHNRSFKPIYIDIVKGDPDNEPDNNEEEEELEEENDEEESNSVMERKRKMPESKRSRFGRVINDQNKDQKAVLTKDQEHSRQLRNFEDNKKKLEKYRSWIEYCQQELETTKTEYKTFLAISPKVITQEQLMKRCEMLHAEFLEADVYIEGTIEKIEVDIIPVLKDMLKN